MKGSESKVLVKEPCIGDEQISRVRGAHSESGNSRSPLRYLLSGAGIQLAAIVSAAVIGFLLTPYMISTLGDRDYGLFALVGSLTGWLGLVDFGLSGAVTRYVAIHYSTGERNEGISYAVTGLYLYLAIGVAAFAIAAVGTLLIPWVLTDTTEVPALQGLVLLSAAAFALEMPLRAISGLLNGFMRRDITSSLGLFGRIVAASVTVAILGAGGRLLSIAWGGFLVAIFTVLLWWQVARWVIPTLHVTRKLAARSKAVELLSYGGISFVGYLGEAAISRLDALVIAWFAGVATVPHYVIAVSLVGYFGSVMQALTAWLINWYAHKRSAGSHTVAESLYIATRYSIILGGLGFFGLVALGRPFIERWMGPDYLDAYPCLVALAIGAFVRASQRPGADLLYAEAKHSIFAGMKVLEAIVNLVLSLWLVHEHGIFGVALGTMIASILVNGLLLPVLTCIATRSNLIRYGQSVMHGIAACSLLLLLPAWLAHQYALPDYVRLVGLGFVSAALYLPGAWFLATSYCERRRLLMSFSRV